MGVNPRSQAVTNASLPLPTGAATEATLSAMSAKLPSSLGAKTGALSFSVVPNTDTNFPVVGAAASGAPSAGNPVRVAARYNTTLPTFADGNAADIQVGTRGSLNVQLKVADGTASIGSGVPSDALSNSTNAIATQALNSVFNGTTWDRLPGTTAGLVQLPYALPASRIYYAAASGGILNTTTAVTMFAAAGASVRNYITSLEIMAEALTNATELAIRDGAAGTVIWRTKIPTGGLPTTQIKFDPPIRSTANTLLEVVTLTASGAGAVYVNAQGYTGA